HAFDRGHRAIDRDNFDSLRLRVSKADVADTVRVLAYFRGDLLVAGHLLRGGRVVALFHGELLEFGIGPGRSVARIDRNLSARTAHRAPVGHFTGEDLFDLALRQGFDWVRGVYDHSDAVIGNDRFFHRHAFGRGRRLLLWLHRTAGHSDLGGAVD